jgi:hypothetical protein
MPPKSVPEPRPIAAQPSPPAPVVSPWKQKVKQQAQLIEALVSQNDALNAKLAANATTTPNPTSPTAIPTPVTNDPPVAPHPEPKPAESFAVPNAEGVIDLVAVTLGQATGEPVNPFAVRMVSAEKTREIALHVGGTVAGENPCAVLNDRLVQPGDVVESLAIERIEADAVILSRGEQRLRLPVAEKPVRVRLPL